MVKEIGNVSSTALLIYPLKLEGNRTTATASRPSSRVRGVWPEEARQRRFLARQAKSDAREPSPGWARTTADESHRCASQSFAAVAALQGRARQRREINTPVTAAQRRASAASATDEKSLGRRRVSWATSDIAVSFFASPPPLSLFLERLQCRDETRVTQAYKGVLQKNDLTNWVNLESTDSGPQPNKFTRVLLSRSDRIFDLKK